MPDGSDSASDFFSPVNSVAAGFGAAPATLSDEPSVSRSFVGPPSHWPGLSAQALLTSWRRQDLGSARKTSRSSSAPANSTTSPS